MKQVNEKLQISSKFFNVTVIADAGCHGCMYRAAPSSAVSNVSGCRYVPDCRSRGREFDPGQVPYFRGDWSWNNFYGYSPPSRWFKKGCCQLQTKVLSSLPRIKSVVRWTHRPDMTIAVHLGVKHQTKQNKQTATCTNREYSLLSNLNQNTALKFLSYGCILIGVLFTLTLAYLSCEFAFRAHLQCVVRTYDLKCVENANQLVSTQGKIHEYSYVLRSVSALTNQNCLFRKKSILKCVDFLIDISNLKVEILLCVTQYYFLPQWFICYLILQMSFILPIMND